MKILYSAFSCNPSRGSEAFCGWSWPITMCTHNDTFIITRPDNKKDIDNYLQENNISGIKVFYCESKLGEKLKIRSAMLFMIYYLLWQRAAYREVKKLHKQYNFDYIHHVSLGDFRFIGKLWKINTKFIFGPVGGAQVTPKSLKTYTKGHVVVEYFRILVNFVLTHTLNYKRAIRKASLVLVANQETGDYISKIYRNINMKLMTENGITNKYLNALPSSENQNNSKVKIIWSGRLIYRKGLSFLVDVVNMIDRNLDYEICIYGDGPEKDYLVNKVRSLNLQDKILFMGVVPYLAMQEAYRDGLIFIFPSIRETTGTVLFEAMANQLAIISFNQNGAKLIVDEKCGILIDVNNEIDVIKKEFAEKLSYLIKNPKLCMDMGAEGKKRIVSNFTWERKINEFVNCELKK